MYLCERVENICCSQIFWLSLAILQGFKASNMKEYEAIEHVAVRNLLESVVILLGVLAV